MGGNTPNSGSILIFPDLETPANRPDWITFKKQLKPHPVEQTGSGNAISFHVIMATILAVFTLDRLPHPDP
ncbi:MAG: hypothetical protein Q8N94_08290 [Methanoregula sp.]|nr:hypothetical protein [Methanoregula sp.]